MRNHKNERSAANRYLSDVSNVYAGSRILKFGFIALIVITLVNAYSIKSISNDTRHYLMPVGATEDIWVTRTSASDSYLSAVAKYAVYSAKSYTPATVESQLSELLTAFHPTTYPRYRETFREVSKRAARYASVSFTIQVDTSKAFVITKDSVRLFAHRKRVAGNSVSRSEYIEYIVRYTIENGRFWIKEIEEKVDA